MIHKKKALPGEFGIFTDQFIPEGNLVFRYEDWIEDEKRGWVKLSHDEVSSLSPEEKHKYLHFSYDIDFGLSTGVFDWKHATHISNFMNHSCFPNLMYDLNDNIIAKTDIYKGEELTIDYGTFIVNYDQEFRCACGKLFCRQHIQMNDWKQLVREYEYHFPTFMHSSISKLMQTDIAQIF